MKTLHPIGASNIQFRIFIVLISIIILPHVSIGQATITNPIGIGRRCSGSTSDSTNTWQFNSTTNSLSLINKCRPSLAFPGFSSSLSSISYNPADGFLYYVRIQSGGGGTYNSFVWRWKPNQCPTGSLPVYRTFNNQFIAGIEFDPAGVGYQVNLTGSTAPYGVQLQQVNFATGTTGPSINVTLPAGVNIGRQSGDIMMTPSGQFLFIFDNKYFTINYHDYNINPLNATFIDSVDFGANNNLVGLSYADGKLIGSIRGSSGTCFYRQINMLTGDTTMATLTGSNFSAFDLTNVTSGIGVAKQLVSAVPSGNPGEYDLSYDVRVQNYGDYPLANVQVTDDLSSIHSMGAAAISNVSTSLIANPAGVNLNASFNGTTVTSLLTGTDSLKNYPVANNYFIIRISMRLSNVVPGTTYFNRAVAQGSGLNAVIVRDTSTNGSNPDLNSNDRPDDAGENQPTPFNVSTAAETPPCTTLSNFLYTQDFGSGTGLWTAMPGLSKTEYSPRSSAPVGVEQYTISDNANNGNASQWIYLPDHTGNPNGRMMLINADNENRKMFVDTVNINCSNLKYSFYLYAAFIGNSSYQTLCSGFGGFKYPNLILTVRNADDNSIIANVSTNNITSTSWNQYGMKWVMPAGVSRVILEIYNGGEGGCGNDLAIDDISFGLCDPDPVVNITGITDGCLGGITNMTTSLSDTSGLNELQYQWQYSNDNSSWGNMSSANSSSLSIDPMTSSDAGYYRILVAANGNSSGCNYISNSYQLAVKAVSVAPTSAVANRNNICPSDAVTLQVNGGALGTNASWRWYSSSCGGTLIGTGTSINVNPSVTTTYYVRAEGDCNVTVCASVTVTVNCDIDDDNDGITDLAESGGVDPSEDHDFDGIENYRDSNYPGFNDSNSDGIHDPFDNDLDGIINSLDLDSDNDGIPDVVESGGVDANGDGVIDDYTDTDNDGLSQNVDANNSGHLSSGSGLGLVDTDGDGVPNIFDLDSDNDGLPDVFEAKGNDLNNNGILDNYSDADADGYADSVDGDTDNNGIAENAANCLLRTGADVNNDGRADSYPYKNFDSDQRANAYDLDSDNDGITDVREAGFVDADSNGFSDGVKGSDGWDDSIASLATLTISNNDSDILPDFTDIDSDNDGVPDNVEGISTASYRLPSSLDDDADGIDNSYDNTVGFGGNGITPNDQDNDAIPDYLDQDTDGDSASDAVEANDINNNCDDDDPITLTGLDTDNDGLDDRFDADNSSIKGTSMFMGNFGTTLGDASPGSFTRVNMCNSSGYERDWRFLPYVLQVTYHDISASRKNGGSMIQWTVSCDKRISHFIVEKSVDGKNYKKIGRVNAKETSLTTSSFQLFDPEAVNGKVYYRVITFDNQHHQQQSRAVMIREKPADQVTVYPNPTHEMIYLSISSSKDQNVRIRLSNSEGRLFVQQRQDIMAGDTVIRLKNNSVLPAGLYLIDVFLGDERKQYKLIVW